MQQTKVCFDTETTTLNPLEAQLVGIAFHGKLQKVFTFLFPEDKEEAQELIEHLTPIF